MSFSTKYKGGELSCIMRILSIFGVVRQQQMRLLFHHMSDAAYGKVLTKLHDEGHIFCPKDGERLASSRLMMNRMKNDVGSVNCFWVFILIRDSILDFCAGDSPTLATIATRDKMIDLIPVTAGSLQAINEMADSTPPDTTRFLVVSDYRMKDSLRFRTKNDYITVVDEYGDIEAYEMRGQDEEQ